MIAIRAAYSAPSRSMGSYVSLGSTLRLKEQFAEAIETYQYCIELNPNWEYPYLSIGSIHLTQGDYDLAMDMFRRADEISDAPEINVRMSCVQAEQGETYWPWLRLRKRLRQVIATLI